MSRTISDRYVLDAVVRAETPLHIGAAAAGFNTDMELVRDGKGRLVLPGTSLTGALRAALRRVDAGLADHPWWGDAPRDSSTGAGAARIVIEDAPRIGEIADDPVAVRDSVRLDRRHASAEDNGLFNREIVYPGARFKLRITIDAGPGKSDEGKKLLDRIVGLLSKSGIDIGGATTRGLGRIRIEPPGPGAEKHCRWVEHRDNRAGMLELLRNGMDREPVEAPPQAVPDPGTLQISIKWQPTTSVMSTQALAASAVDTLPAVSVDPSDPGRLRLLLAGTGLAGAFSARVERIARTLLADSVGEAADQLERHDMPGVAELLGTPGRGRNLAGAASAVRFADCLGQASFDKTQWVNRVEGDRSQIPLGGTESMEKNDKQRDLILTARALAQQGLTVATHNGIDRWTGGAADQLLFAVAEPARSSTQWDPLQLTVDPTLLERGPDDGAAGWALLLLGLKALTTGSITLGGLATRGLGTIKVQAKEITFSAGDGVAEPTVAWALADAGMLSKALSSPVITRLNEALAQWYPTAEKVA